MGGGRQAGVEKNDVVLLRRESTPCFVGYVKGREGFSFVVDQREGLSVRVDTIGFWIGASIRRLGATGFMRNGFWTGETKPEAGFSGGMGFNAGKDRRLGRERAQEARGKHRALISWSRNDLN
jgi:hypothetical protein